MKSSFYFDKSRNLIVVEKTGTVSVDEDIALITKIRADASYRPGMNSIIDMTTAIYDWGMKDIDRFRLHVHEMAKEMGPTKWALVSNGGVTLSNAKLYVMLHEVRPSNLNLKLFTARFDAIKWLESDD
jgi:hypothetical protein